MFGIPWSPSYTGRATPSISSRPPKERRGATSCPYRRRTNEGGAAPNPTWAGPTWVPSATDRTRTVLSQLVSESSRALSGPRTGSENWSALDRNHTWSKSNRCFYYARNPKLPTGFPKDRRHQEALASQGMQEPIHYVQRHGYLTAATGRSRSPGASTPGIPVRAFGNSYGLEYALKCYTVWQDPSRTGAVKQEPVDFVSTQYTRTGRRSEDERVSSSKSEVWTAIPRTHNPRNSPFAKEAYIA